MEVLHKPETKAFISDPVSVKAFFNQWQDNLNQDRLNVGNTEQDKLNYLTEKLKVDEETIKELMEVCDPDTLTCEGESMEYFYSTSRRKGLNLSAVPTESELVTLQLKRNELEKYVTDYRYRNSILNWHKEHSSDHQLRKAYRCLPQTEPFTAPDVILTVNIYMPFKRTDMNCIETPLKHSQEFVVLGRQKLTELRDHINCVSDWFVPGDFSQDPDAPFKHHTRDLCKSGFFYINGTFYNDMRDPTNKDYSKTVIDWANDSKRGVGPFEVAKMEDYTFMDLTLRLGYPYLYIHQGNCEHLLVFSDLRLFGPRDCQNIAKYPLIMSMRRLQRALCMVCHVYTAKWLTFGNSKLPYDPFFFCDACLKAYNYDREGKKIGDFSLYPYFDRSAVL